MAGIKGRYPALKFVLSGMTSAKRAHVLVKVNARPAKVPEIDSLVQLENCELRPAWSNAAGVVPESLVVADLCDREISVTLPASKRRRDALQRLGAGSARGSTLT